MTHDRVLENSCELETLLEAVRSMVGDAAPDQVAEPFGEPIVHREGLTSVEEPDVSRGIPAGGDRGKRAPVEPAEDAISEACHNGVAEISQRPWHDTEEERGHTPATAKAGQDGQHGIGTDARPFLVGLRLLDEDDGATVLAGSRSRLGSAELLLQAGERAASEGPLQGGEAEPFPPIVAQNEQDEPIAQPANAVV